MRLIPTILALSLFSVPTAQAAFRDVMPDAWYESAVRDFFDAGFLSGNDFRAGEAATRAEYVELIVRVLGGAQGGAELLQRFDDVTPRHLHFLFFAEAARAGWIRGDKNCAGTRPCYARPNDSINRAEAASLLNRVFGLQELKLAPAFADAPAGQWYTQELQIAADHCVIVGDDGGGTVRPADTMNRAEMVVMVSRLASGVRRYSHCDAQEFVDPAKGTVRLRPQRSESSDEIRRFTGEWNLSSPQVPTGVALMRFDMTANTVQDVILRRLTFEAAQGSLFNARNYDLWVDHDRDGTVETLLQGGVGADGGFVTFQKLYGGGYVVTEETVTFELRASISGSPKSTTLQLRLAEDGIGAEELDGETLDSGMQITTHRTPAKVFTILPHGNLFISQSSAPLRSRQLLGGTVSPDLLRLTFRADDEDIDVTNVQISSRGSTASSISSLLLFKEGESSPLAEATVSGCSGEDALALDPENSTGIRTFCVSLSSGSFTIPEDERVDLLVRARVKSDSEGGITGESVRLWITGQAVANIISGSGAIRARGRSSSGNLSGNDGDNTAEGEIFIGKDSAGGNSDIVGPVHEVIMAKIVSITNASTVPDGSAVPSGTQSIGSFRITASTNGNAIHGSNTAVVEKLILTVAATNVTLDAESFHVLNTSDSSITKSCTAKDSDGMVITGNITGTILVECTGLDSSPVATEIGSGEAMLIALRATVVNPNVSSSGGSSLQISLQGMFSRASSFGVGASHIHWIDRDAGGDTDVYWVDSSATEVRSTLYRL